MIYFGLKSQRHYISVSHSSYKKGWGRFLIHEKNGTSTNIMFKVVEKIHIAYTHHQAFGYFGLKGIGNIDIVLPKPLVLSSLLNLATSNQEAQTFYDRVHPYMIDKAIDVSIKKDIS